MDVDYLVINVMNYVTKTKKVTGSYFLYSIMLSEASKSMSVRALVFP